MKKQLLPLRRVIALSAVFLSSFAFSQVTSFPWTEGFEDGSPTISQWTKVYEQGSKEWSTTSSYYAYTPTTPHAGDKFAQFDCATFSGDKTKYVSPVLDLSSIANPTLDFFYRNKSWGGDQNILKVYYRTSSTGAWTLLMTYDTNVTTWTTSTAITLPNPSSTYQIALEGTAMYGYHINVDELTVKSANLGINETNATKSFSVYPNPAKDVLNIKSNSPISEYTIFDTNGKKILNSTEGSEQIKVNELGTGLYILQAKDKNGKVNTQKFIKE